MEKIRKHCSNFSMLFSLIMLLQGCVVYQRTPVSLEQAAKAKARSKVFTTDGTFTSFKYIIEVKSEFYGVKKRSGALVEVPLGNNPDTEVFLKNKSTSQWLTLGLIVYTAGAAALLVWITSSDWDIN